MKLVKFIFFLAFVGGIAVSIIYHQQVYRTALKVYYQKVKKEGMEDSLAKARAMYSKEQYAKLKPYLSDLVMLYPGNRELLRLAGLARIETGDRLGGARMVTAALRDGEDLSAMQSVLEILYDEKEYAELNDVFARHAPNDRYLEFMCGMSLAACKRWEEAVPHLVNARKRGQDGFELHFALGTAYENLGRLDDAIASYEAAFALEPHKADARQSLQRAYRKAKKYDKAERLGR